MALGGSNGPVTDSPVLVITSALAIAVVFVLIMLLIILRARHVALRRQQAMRTRELWDMQLFLRFKDKPVMHEVWLSGAPVASSPDTERLNQNEWDKIMVRSFDLFGWNCREPEIPHLQPLFAVDEDQSVPITPCEVSTCSVGVVLRLPHPRAPIVTEVSDISSTSPVTAVPPGSEILFGLSILPVVKPSR
jgi:hypothetical protein